MVISTTLLYNNLDTRKGQGATGIDSRRPSSVCACSVESGASEASTVLGEAVKIWLNSLYLSNSSQTAENYNKKAGRFLVRGFRGVAVGLAKGYRFRWFVLTESNEAAAAGLDFGKAFHKLVTWLRYYCSDFQYIVVEHRKPRRHWHLVTYGTDKLPVDAIRGYWLNHYLSTISGMAEIRNIERAMYYVCGYLKRGGKLTRSWSSAGWVFAGWIGFCREYCRDYGEYPPGGLLVELSLMSKERRIYELEWLKNTGELSRLYLDCEVKV